MADPRSACQKKMPVYCFTNARTGDTICRVYPMGSAPSRILEAGRVYERDYRAENASVPATKGWPLECVASGVHPSQAQELRDFYKSRGVPTEVTPDGNPVYRDARHRRRALKARGFRDRSSYD